MTNQRRTSVSMCAGFVCRARNVRDRIYAKLTVFCDRIMDALTNPAERRIMTKRLKSVSFMKRRIAASSLRNDASAMASSNSRVSK